jgi:predicted RNA-binding protein (virulence factor B family)
MNSLITPGKIQTLLVHSIEGKFVHLGNADEQVPLLRREFPGLAEEGKEVTVFTYFDNNKQLIATTKLPTIEVGQIGSFRVKNMNNLGAFIDIGTDRDILIPFPEMRDELEENRWALIILLFDEMSQRIYASTKLNTHIKNSYVPFDRGDEVDMIIGERMELGRRVIIEGKYMGLLFKQEMLRTYGEGDKVKGYIRKVENNEITVSTQKEGQELIDEGAERILSVLESNKGYLRLTDDSDPEEIKRYLTMSKKTFKKAAGLLYKEQKITLTDRGIRLGGSEELKRTDGNVKPMRDNDNERDGKRKRLTQVSSERNREGGSKRRMENSDDRPARRDGDDRPPRREYSDRPPRRDGDDRPPRREFSDRAPRRDGDSRPPRREYSDRPPRRDGDDRPPRREFSDRAPRRDGDSRPPRREYSDRPPRRDGDDRPPRREFSDRAPRRDGDSRPPRREYSDRPPRRDGDDRPPRREFSDRAPRRDGDDRPPRKTYGDRPPRRDGDSRPPRREFSDRAPRRDGDDRPPRREYSDRPPRRDGDSRPPRREFSDRAPRRDGDDRPPRKSYGDRPPRKDGDDKPRRTYGEQAERGPSRNRFEKEIDKADKRNHEKTKPKFQVNVKSKSFTNPQKGKPKRFKKS